MERIKKKKFNIISPDGFPISYDWFDSEESAWEFFRKWKTGYERQGYYSANHARIPINRLEECVYLDFYYEE